MNCSIQLRFGISLSKTIRNLESNVGMCFEEKSQFSRIDFGYVNILVNTVQY